MTIFFGKPKRITGKPKKQPELMTAEEVHEFGINIVAEYLQKNGYTEIQVCRDPAINPQITAIKEQQPVHIAVRTACYPEHGRLGNEDIARQLVRDAREHGATCYFAPVGLYNADAQNQTAAGLAIQGGKFYVSFKGLEILTSTDQVTLWLGEDDYKSDKLEQLIILLAQSWNGLSPDTIVDYLSPDIIYESQQVLTPMVGKELVVNYLREKMAVIAQDLENSQVFAELAFWPRPIQGQKPSEIPCILLAQGSRENTSAVVLVQSREELINRIDICTVVPNPAMVRRTAIYLVSDAACTVVNPHKVDELVQDLTDVFFQAFWYGSDLLTRAQKIKDPRIVRIIAIRHHFLQNKEAGSCQVLRQTVKHLEGPDFQTLWQMLFDTDEDEAQAALYILSEIGGIYAFRRFGHEIISSSDYHRTLALHGLGRVIIRYLQIMEQGKPVMQEMDIKSGQVKTILQKEQYPDIYARTMNDRREADEYFILPAVSEIEATVAIINNIPGDEFPWPKINILVALNDLSQMVRYRLA
ncbi:MAG: hypothetical protein GXY40_01075 [Syntrophomonadaceae bacterium]|nr:hypothetical protein [Syntrophomonadaceae bacterium]